MKRNVFTNIGNGIEKAAQKIKEEAISAAKKTACSACVVSVGVVQYLLTHTKWFPVVSLSHLSFFISKTISGSS